MPLPVDGVKSAVPFEPPRDGAKTANVPLAPEAPAPFLRTADKTTTSGLYPPIPNTLTTVTVPAVPYEEGDYVWKNLNYYYYWQEFVANLADSKATSASSYASFINENPNPINFFNSLKHPDDRFSGIFPDYDFVLDQFSGIVTSDGINYVIFRECNQVNAFLFVTYVDKNSSAELAGIQRGHIITSVNGTSLTFDNASNLMNNNYSSNTYGFGTYENNSDNTCANISRDEAMVTVDKYILNNNPVYLYGVWDNYSLPEWDELFGVPLPKVGYILYNKFGK